MSKITSYTQLAKVDIKTDLLPRQKVSIGAEAKEALKKEKLFSLARDDSLPGPAGDESFYWGIIEKLQEKSPLKNKFVTSTEWLIPEKLVNQLYRYKQGKPLPSDGGLPCGLGTHLRTQAKLLGLYFVASIQGQETFWPQSMP